MAREHVHLVGIGGTGMTALAGLFHESGARVSGSDVKLYPPTSTILERMGVRVFEGYDARNLEPVPDLVVVGNAVRRGNPEAEEALDRRLPFTSMPRAIEERFLPGRHVIVVAGTHGKTTTATLVAWLLHQAGRDPGFLIGGLPRNFENSYRVGGGPVFVIEGDEYDTAFFDKGPKFMHYRPDTALIGTVEFDHADIYTDLDHVKRVFRWLTNIVPRRGLIVRHEDDAVAREVTSSAMARLEGYGLERGLWRAESVEHHASGMLFRILRDSTRFANVATPMSGTYNVRNALAATAAVVEQGLSAQEIVNGLATFEGVQRRLEVKGEADGVLIVDDFAHHPTAIGETLRAVRFRWPGRKIWAVLEPRSWSLRRNVFQNRLPAALEEADEVVIAGVFGAEELPEGIRLDPAKLVADLATRGRPALFLPDVGAIVAHLGAHAAPGDLVAVLSNGGFGGIHAALLEAFDERAAAGGR